MGNSSFNSDNLTQLQVTENPLIKALPKALTTKYLQAYHYHKCSAADTHWLGDNINAHMNGRREHNTQREMCHIHVLFSITLMCCTL